tara:strand:- start:231 stop:1106 length:876 start_codon:yes stop_codon:yes gene_type:complete
MKLKRSHILLVIIFLSCFDNAISYELSPGKGYLTASRKITCSLKDNQPIVYWWYGRVYSRVPGERDKLLFRVEGMNIRQCATIEDDKRGLGFRMVSRELLFYQDPKTGEILDTWDNPWTGDTVEVLHVANDPVNWGNTYELDKNGDPYQMDLSIHGDYWWDTSTIPLFYKNPLGGDYQDYVGGIYHATEMFNTTGNVSDLTDDSKDTAEVRVGWERMSDWLPWMKMSGRTGIVYFHTFGRKLESFDQLPESFKYEIEKNYPKYKQPPPIDDQRKNETSWTYFKKTLSNNKD